MFNECMACYIKGHIFFKQSSLINCRSNDSKRLCNLDKMSPIKYSMDIWAIKPLQNSDCEKVFRMKNWQCITLLI